jgi:bifunctional DNase/RNase
MLVQLFETILKAPIMVEMKVEGLTLDPLTNMPIIILKDLAGDKALPIWVGYFEANAIALEIEKINTPRPMTHDLLNNIISSLQAKVKHILVTDLKDNTFFAEISVIQNGSDMTIDSRPSDAIALALRSKSPIFVEEKVIEAAKSLDLPDPDKLQNQEKQQWKDWITSIKPQDFGKL